MDNKLHWRTSYNRRTGILESAETTYTKNMFEFEIWYFGRNDNYIRVSVKLFSKHYKKWAKIDSFEIKELSNDAVITAINNWLLEFQKQIA